MRPQHLVQGAAGRALLRQLSRGASMVAIPRSFTWPRVEPRAAMQTTRTCGRPHVPLLGAAPKFPDGGPIGRHHFGGRAAPGSAALTLPACRCELRNSRLADVGRPCRHVHRRRPPHHFHAPGGRLRPHLDTVPATTRPAQTGARQGCRPRASRLPSPRGRGRSGRRPGVPRLRRLWQDHAATTQGHHARGGLPVWGGRRP